VVALLFTDYVGRLRHLIEDVPRQAQANRRGRAQDAVVPGEYFPAGDMGLSGHDLILQQKYHTCANVWYF